MYITNENTGNSIIENDENETGDAIKKDLDARSAHDKWKSSVNSRKCRDFSSMSYWQKVSTCTQL